MSIGKKIFFSAGSLILILVISQGALTTFMVKGSLETNALRDLQDKTEGIVNKLSDTVAQTEADLDIMRAHQATEDFLTFLLFEDASSMSEEIDKLEIFYKRVLNAKVHYSKLQLSAHNKPLLQLTAGERLEKFDHYDYAASREQLQIQLQNDERGIIHHFRGAGENLTIISVAALMVDGTVEGMLWLEQPIGVKVGLFLDKLSNQHYYGAINDGEVLIARSKDLDQNIALHLHSNKLDDWVSKSQLIPEFGWQATISIKKEDAYAVVNELLVAVAIIVVVALIAAIFVLGGSTLFFVIRPLNTVVDRMRDISEGDGDLTIMLDEDRKDEIGQLALAFNLFVTKTREAIINVKKTCRELKIEAQQLESVISLTGTSITRQKLETNQVAVSAQELSATAQEVTRVTVEATEAAEQATRESQHGKKIVETGITSIRDLANGLGDVCSAVQRLAQDSDNINSIMEVIHGIAEQTNLLALNAAIEAARAGEHGRGFAVVADEVRQLAKNTQKSTKQIHNIIESLRVGSKHASEVMEFSLKHATDSVDNAELVVTSFDRIAAAIESLSNINSMISNTAKEQGVVTENVTRHITGIKEVMHETEESTLMTVNTTQALAKVAIQLEKTVEQFKIQV